jgi:poly(3-hydroxybutyrate) depolymerase
VIIDKVVHQPIDQVIATWVKTNNCDPVQVTSTTAYELNFYVGNFPVALYKILQGGHQWPGGVDLTPRDTASGYLDPNVPASELICQFFGFGQQGSSQP